ncbi:MAG: pyridoxamine 5'-phosphate oxidase family protein [Gammaproteobacteria bacterium]|jgi:nitroimidazol reductase NimA-like FMN-containing flavoprotein (pyridoxamine 5'-phosphate oxidase superfamily)|nr:pyridoxamine 5'-phosphate oxidase family protein [Gammaproteobacteria bacterium]MBT4492930.1 pyridoxamine 5'-phosphate oxidase family protein [Gammaproteobacteria bacterium]MBT7369775.1 pyridoxamine 5'-phosphate oxidase family protein [Gammaproteobacteria bacterium]
MSRRDQINLNQAEITDFLKNSRTIILVSNGKNGYPHPMPMWYAVGDDNTIYMTTFRKSQKINNLRKDPKCALLVESGDAYQELKSVLIYTEVELVEETEDVRDILFNISVQRGDVQADAGDAVRDGMNKSASKRIGMKFAPNKIVTWDHSKLGGVY